MGFGCLAVWFLSLGGCFTVVMVGLLGEVVGVLGSAVAVGDLRWFRVSG